MPPLLRSCLGLRPTARHPMGAEPLGLVLPHRGSRGRRRFVAAFIAPRCQRNPAFVRGIRAAARHRAWRWRGPAAGACRQWDLLGKKRARPGEANPAGRPRRTRTESQNCRAWKGPPEILGSNPRRTDRSRWLQHCCVAGTVLLAPGFPPGLCCPAVTQFQFRLPTLTRFNFQASSTVIFYLLFPV